MTVKTRIPRRGYRPLQPLLVVGRVLPSPRRRRWGPVRVLRVKGWTRLKFFQRFVVPRGAFLLICFFRGKPVRLVFPMFFGSGVGPQPLVVLPFPAWCPVTVSRRGVLRGQLFRWWRERRLRRWGSGPFQFRRLLLPRGRLPLWGRRLIRSGPPWRGRGRCRRRGPPRSKI